MSTEPDLPAATRGPPSRATPVRIALAIILVAIVAGVGIAARRHEERDALPLAVGGPPTTAMADAGYPVGEVRYRAGDGLPVLDGEATAYQLGSPAEDAVGRLAAALDLGDRLARDRATWRAVEGDRTLVVVAESGMWQYSATDPDGSVSSGAIGPDGKVAAPDPKAEPAARAFVDKAGLDLDGATVSVAAGEPTAVTFDPPVDGVATVGMSTGVMVDGDGAVVFAAGMLGRPQGKGSFALIGTGPAINRLNRGPGLGILVAPGPPPPPPVVGPEPETTIPGDSVGGSGSSPGAGGGSSGVGPSTTGTLVPPEGPPGSRCDPPSAAGEAPACGEPVPPSLPPCDGSGAPTTFACEGPPPSGSPEPPRPEPVTVTLTGAEIVLALMPGRPAGSLWLVPAYRLKADDGTEVVTPAVADDDVDLAPPPEPQPQPEPAPLPAPGPTPETGTRPPSPPPATAPAPDLCAPPGQEVDPGTTVTGPPPAGCPSRGPETTTTTG